jgi:hypothetical protein
MDENNYRQTYREFNDLPCVYEKAILQQCCTCRRARHFNLAERIGVACSDPDSQGQCREFLGTLQQKSVFALQIPGPIDSELPHSKKIKIQCGGIIGLQQIEKLQIGDRDVNALLDRAIEVFGDLQSLPFEELVRGVVSFEGRRRKRPRKRK